jgi:hypothetical protein
MILDWQQFRLPGLHPVRCGGGLALGAVAVAARVVGDLPMATPIALLDVSAQRGGPASRDVAQGAALLGPERFTILVEEGITVASEDLGHFEPRRRQLYGPENLSYSCNAQVDFGPLSGPELSCFPRSP